MKKNDAGYKILRVYRFYDRTKIEKNSRDARQHRSCHLGKQPPLKLKHFLLLNVQSNRNFAHFSEIWKRRKSQIFALF